MIGNNNENWSICCHNEAQNGTDILMMIFPNMSATHNKNAIQKICCTVVPNKDLGIRNEMNLLKFMPTYFIGNAKMTLFCIPKAWIIDPFGRFIPNT